MKKNTGSQVVVAQLVSKTDGAAVTSGTTTVYVLGDGGTQATGSVGSGAATHEGNGVWSYAPAQAETNYDHVAFTFVNSTAVNATVQIYTSFPQTGDNFARLGAPAGASVSADVAAIKSDSGAIKTKTDFLPSATAGSSGGVFIAGSNAATTVNITGNVTGNVSGSVGSVTARVTANTDQLAGQTVTAAAGVTFPTSVASPTNITAGTITTVTNLTNAPTSGDFTSTMKTSIGTAVAASAVASVTGNVGGNVTGSVGSVVGAVGSVTGNVGGNVGGNVTGSIGSLATQAKADVNAEVDAAIVDAALATAANLATVDTVVDAILVDTAEIGAAGAGLTALASASALSTVAGYVDTEVGAIKAVTDKLDDTLENDGGTYRFTAAALAEGPSGGSAPTTAQIADKILGRSLEGGTDGGRTVQDALRSLRNKSAIAGGTLTVYEEDDSTPAWTATVTTAAGDPLSSIDPA